MSEEEKKIIDRINKSYDDNTQYVEASAEDWNCIVHLINKQQKEIEELKSLKDENHFLKEMYRGTTEYKAIKKKVEELGWD